MDPLEQYFQEQFHQDKDEIARLDDVLKSVWTVFRDFYCDDRWPYEITGSSPEYPAFSFSTTAMIAFTLAHACGRLTKSVLVPDVKVANPPDDECEIYKIVQGAFGCAVKKSMELREKDDSAVVESTSFGQNDPLTCT